MRGNSIWLAATLGCLLLLSVAGDTRAEPSEELGLVHFEAVESEGAVSATGEVLLDGELLRTETSRALVHLRNGGVLKLGPNSSARFEALAFDEVAVTVFSGRVVQWSGKGKPLTAGAGSRFTVRRSSLDPLVAERELLRHGLALRSVDESAARRQRD